MCFRVAGIAAACIATGVVATQAQAQAPVTVVGQVVSAVTGAPVGGVNVSLNGETQGGTQRKAVAGDDGRFVFDNVPAGRYYMFASKPGFFMTGLNDDTQHGSSDVLVIGWPGPPVITMRLRPHGSITGTVVDDADRPVAGAKVTALSKHQVWPSWGKRHAWEPLDAPGVTDERGRYVMEAVKAGDYLIQVDATGIRIPGSSPMTFGTAYAPGARDIPTAVLFTLAFGERRVVDVRLRAMPAFDLSGVAEVPADRGSVYVRLLSLDDAGTQHRRHVADQRVDAGETFTFARLPPGDYVLAGNVNDRFSGEQNVTIADRSVADVHLVLAPAIVVSGRIIWEGVERPPDRSTLLRSMRSNVEGRPVGDSNPGQFVAQVLMGLAEMLPVGPSAPEIQPLRLYLVNWTSDTTFTLMVPRERFIAGHGGVSGWFVKSLRINGREATDEPVDIDSNSSDAVLTLTQAMGEVQGTVVAAAGGPDPGCMAVLFSTNPRVWPGLYARQDLHVYRGNTDDTGRFTITDVIPGDYYLAAISQEEANHLDPAMLQRLAGSASRLQVPANVPIVRTLTRVR